MSLSASINTPSVDAKGLIKQLKEQGCVCVEAMYGMSLEDMQRTPRIRRLIQTNPQRYFIGPSLGAGRNFGVGLWRHPIV